MTDPDTTDEGNGSTRLLHTSVAQLAIEIRGVQAGIDNPSDMVGCRSPTTVGEVYTPTDTETQIVLENNRLEYAEYEQLAESLIENTTGVGRDKMIVTSCISEADQPDGDTAPNRYTPRLNIIFDIEGCNVSEGDISRELASRIHIYELEADGDCIIAATDVAFLDSLGEMVSELGIAASDVTLAAKAVEESDESGFIWDDDE